jgi:hypothetical protein
MRLTQALSPTQAANGVQQLVLRHVEHPSSDGSALQALSPPPGEPPAVVGRPPPKGGGAAPPPSGRTEGPPPSDRAAGTPPVEFVQAASSKLPARAPNPSFIAFIVVSPLLLS